FPLKTVGDAIALQSQIIEQLEMAEVSDNPERKKWHLSFAVVGGGFSGVEVAGEINDFVRQSARFYKHFKAAETTVTLIHAGEQILPEVSASLREFAREKMEQSGVKVLLKPGASVCTADGVGLSDGS